MGKRRLKNNTVQNFELEPKGRKPLYKRVWFWAILVVVGLIAISPTPDRSTSALQTNASQAQSSIVQTAAEEEESQLPEEPAEAEEAPQEEPEENPVIQESPVEDVTEPEAAPVPVQSEPEPEPEPTPAPEPAPEPEPAPAPVVVPAPAPEPEPEPEIVEAEPAAVNYIANKNTGKFHYPSCSSVKDMAEHNKLYWGGTRDELVDKGYVPCKRCNP